MNKAGYLVVGEQLRKTVPVLLFSGIVRYSDKSIQCHFSLPSPESPFLDLVSCDQSAKSEASTTK